MMGRKLGSNEGVRIAGVFSPRAQNIISQNIWFISSSLLYSVRLPRASSFLHTSPTLLDINNVVNKDDKNIDNININIDNIANIIDKKKIKAKKKNEINNNNDNDINI